MPDVTITVRGEHDVRIAPERATLRISIRADGPDRTAVVDRALAQAEPVRARLTEQQGVAEWTSKRLIVRSERPWNDQGKQLDPVYYASVDFTATFAGASELSAWVTEVSTWDGVEIGGVNWELTPQTRAAAERDVATSAVGIAVQRAEAYAAALGLSTVTPIEVADTGLISRDAMATPRMTAAFAVADSSSMEYEPEDIVVSATVEARFAAS